MNIVFFNSSENMKGVKENSIDLVITSPPYFNIKDYSKDGKQKKVTLLAIQMMLGI